MNQTQYFYLGEALFWKKNYRNGVLTKESRYNYDGNQLVQERDANNNLVNEYTWGLGLPGGIGGLLDLYKSAVHYSYLYDGKGNVTALLDPLGNTAAAYQYDPFGAPRGPANTLSQPFQFSTKPYDDKTGLSYYGYRFYVPALGRWLTRDPIGEKGGINLYGFVRNNPVNSIDPWGLLCYTGNPDNPALKPDPDKMKFGANDPATVIKDAVAWYSIYHWIWGVPWVAGGDPPPIWPPISPPPSPPPSSK